MDITEVIIKLIIIVILVALNGFFVAAEFAIVKMRMSRLNSMIEAGNRRAVYAKPLVEHVDVSLSVTQLGITLASLGLGLLGEPTISHVLKPVFEIIGLSGALSTTISFIIAFSLVTAATIIIGELIPKNVAIQQVERVMLAVAIPLMFFQKIMYPSVWVLNKVAVFVAGIFGVDISNNGDEVAHTEDEIRRLMEESHKQGYIDKTELDFVDNVFDFADRNVREIMIPRTDMVCLYLEDSFEENIKVAMEEHLTRYPVCGEDKDDIVGFLHIKDLMQSLYKRRRPILRKLVRRTLVVPETMKISMLLKMMQKQRSQLAIVVDEYGGTAGMVTIEDVIEEIVGEIQDEFDQERPSIEKRSDLIYSIDAMLLLEEVSDIFEMEIEADNIDTIGGWLYNNVQSPPMIGMKASCDCVDFFVEEIDNLRITRILLQLKKPLVEDHPEITAEEEI
ncbi:Hemolysin, contains CBS domains [Anaerovibrio lipolyticus DSM 3074]|uniref:Membrane protein n=2 Tax=Anaerovibrio lipolyticus TaxID=82374 RepID=A0A0B2K049_9FIRM|nr:hemolysin family protein [Anaerovibrio lipolyticus]KHM52211.1 membrane protein [Anaerovibrio lipolyticus]SHI92313.1 Hemolysin, contains CBS domains [Anaerovibrio lipolyticus DSM 3074]